jgi:NitT/TauT family transport system substrate-binding protein
VAVQERTRVKIVPHFMRLQEWIALEEGFYQAEGLETELLADVMHTVSSHGADPYFERPQDAPFREGLEVANSACHWGSVCNAGAGMGKFVPDVYGVARFAIFTRPGSRVQRLSDLRDVPVGVGVMAGSHFTTLTTLEQVLPREHVRVENIGGPGKRLVALLDGQVEAATLLDPEIPIAEANGLRKLAQGEFRTLFWVSPSIGQDVLNAYFRALKRADEALRAAPERYMRLWKRNVPPELQGPHDYSTFGLGELLFFERYSEQEFRDTLQFAHRWGLDLNVRETSYEKLTAPVAV